MAGQISGANRRPASPLQIERRLGRARAMHRLCQQLCRLAQ
jgi:hypothetical protein